MIYLYCTFALIFFGLTDMSSAKPIEYDVHNFTCYFSPDYFNYGECSYKKVNRYTATVYFNASLKVDIPEETKVHAIAEFKSYLTPNSPYRTLMKIDNNACEYIENHQKYMPFPVSKEMMDLIKTHTNIPMHCPYKANREFLINDFPMTSENAPLPLLLPAGKYHVRNKLKFEDKLIFQAEVYSIVS